MLFREHLEENSLTRRLAGHTGNTKIEFSSWEGKARAIVGIEQQESSVGDTSTTHRIDAVSLKFRNTEGETVEIHANRQKPIISWLFMGVNQGKAPEWNIRVLGKGLNDRKQKVEEHTIDLPGEWRLESDAVHYYIQNTPAPPRRGKEPPVKDWGFEPVRVPIGGSRGHGR